MSETQYTQSKGVLVQRTAMLQQKSVYESLVSGGLKDVADDQPVLIIGRLGKLFYLNITGALVWEALKEPRNLSSLAAMLIDLYYVVPFQASRSVERLMSSLVENRLVVASS